MCGHVSLMEVVVTERLADARAAAAQERLLLALRQPRPPLRAVVGARLMELGARLLGSAGAAPPGRSGEAGHPGLASSARYRGSALARGDREVPRPPVPPACVNERQQRF